MREKARFFSILVLALAFFFMPLACTPISKSDTSQTSGLKNIGLAYATVPHDLNVRSAIIVEMKTGLVLYEQNADRRIPPASLTKVISMLVALDAVQSGQASLKDKVRISSNAAGQDGSRMHIKKGELITLDRLLMGMAVSSGNDASVAVAEHIAGSTKAFVQKMNATAKKLGMNHTVFKNPNGLPAAGQYTTARDMSRLGRYYLRKYPDVLRYHNTKTLIHNGQMTTNKNPLLGVCPGADGLKTGWIRASGYNIISTAERDGTRLLTVVLGAPTSQVRSAETRRLLEAGFLASKSHIAVATALHDVRLKNLFASAEKFLTHKTAQKNLTGKKKKKVSKQSVASRNNKKRQVASQKTQKQILAKAKQSTKVASKKRQNASKSRASVTLPRRHAQPLANSVKSRKRAENLG